MVSIFTNCGICHSELSEIESECGETNSNPVQTRDSLECQLNVVFLLRNIFKLESSQLQIYLQKWGNPGDWFKLCRRCEGDVSNIRRIFEKLHEISRDLEKSKDVFQDKLRVSMRADRFPGVAEVLRECRQSLYRKHKENRSKPPTFNPFERGDLLASQLALKVKEEEIGSDADWNYDMNQPTSSTKKRRKRKATTDGPSTSSPKRRICTISKPIFCPVCDARYPLLSTFMPFSLHFQECVATLAKLTNLRCSMCKTWSCCSTKPLKFMAHVVCCRDNHKSAPIPWRHAIIKCNLCEDTKCGPLPLPDYARHIHHFHKHDYGCSQCSHRFRNFRDICRPHWKRHHKNLPDTPQDDRFTKLADGSSLPLPHIPWWCPASKCLQQFPDETSRDEHLTICQAFTEQSPQRSEQCSFCNREYFSKEEVLIHRVTVHGYFTPRDHNCRECDIAFQNSRQLRRHQRTEHHVHMYRCDNCEEEFDGHNLLRTHQRREHGRTESKDFVCHICSKAYVYDAMLRRHIKEAHEENDEFQAQKGHPCPKEGCGKILKTSAAVKVHLTKYHPTHSRSFMCSFCGKMCCHDAEFRKHTKTCHMKIFKCSKCKLRFGKQELLDDHTPKCLGQEGHNKCTVCNETFTTRWHLQKHAKSKSCREENCPVCQKYFKSFQNLKQHKAAVHGIGDYPCGVEGCSKVFSNNSRLKKHKEHVHDDRSKFRCTFCGKGFAEKTKLTYHEQALHVNREIKPFKCDLCENKTFATKPYLVYHLKHTHKIDKTKGQ